MLSQKLGLSLPTVRLYGGWKPTDDTCLLSWHKLATDVTFDASAPFAVSRWGDSSGNDNHLIQNTISQRPTYAGNVGATRGQLTFDPAATQNLDFTNQITITGDFTIALRLDIDVVGNTLLADNDAENEWLRTINSTTLRVKIGGSFVNINLDAPNVWGDNYLVLTRASDVISIWFDGVLQADNETLDGSVLIDNFGVRKTDNNPYSGLLMEMQIYNCSNAELTANVISSIKDI